MSNIFSNISDFLSGGNNSKAAEATQNGVDQFTNLDTPDVDQMQLQLQQLVQQGVLTPEQAQVYQQDPSAMNGISTDPALQKAQYGALDSLQGIADAGGMTDTDKANLNNIQTDENTAQRGSREAILQNAAARGMGGSGMELLSQMVNQQDSANRQSQKDMDVAGTAQQRALAALQSAGALGGQMQQTSFNQQADVAKSNDAINQFNTANSQSVGNLNTAARNNAAAANLTEKQRVSDANTATANSQQQYNKNLQQQDFENQYKKAGGTAGAYQNQAGQFNNAGKQITDLVGKGVQAGATAYAASDENLKKDIEDFDASAFLDSLTPSKYQYKDPKFGEGKQVGVMAQDIEKEVPQMVEDTPEGKMVDYNKAGGPIFASLAHLHDRMKKLEGRE